MSKNVSRPERERDHRSRHNHERLYLALITKTPPTLLAVAAIIWNFRRH